MMFRSSLWNHASQTFYTVFTKKPADYLYLRNPVRRNGDRILSRPRQTNPDENDNVVDRITGKEVLKPGDRRGDRKSVV